MTWASLDLSEPHFAHLLSGGADPCIGCGYDYCRLVHHPLETAPSPAYPGAHSQMQHWSLPGSAHHPRKMLLEASASGVDAGSIGWPAVMRMRQA